MKTKTQAEVVAAGKARRKIVAREPVWECRARHHRLQLGLTLEEVATDVGVSVAAVAAVERGRDPMLTTAFRLAKFYGRKVEDLWPAAAKGGAP